MTTKVHAVVDALGNPLRIHLTAGNVNDIVPACGLIEGLLADKLLADRAYDANKLLALGNAKATKWSFLQCRADCSNESTTLMRTKSVIWLNAFLPSSNHSVELLLGMISSP